MHIDEFHQSVLQFSTLKSEDEIIDLTNIFCRRLGFDNFIYALTIPLSFTESRLVKIIGYPNSRIERYFEQNHFADDPRVKHCRRCYTPIQGIDLELMYSESNELIMNEAKEIGLLSGISMPIHGSRGEFGILSFVVQEHHIRMERAITQNALPFIQLITGYIHEAVIRVYGLLEENAVKILTAREKECLRWSADGKTSWEIGQLLNLSERTVNFHVSNIIAKLKVSNKQHAVAKAVHNGLVYPHLF